MMTKKRVLSLWAGLTLAVAAAFSPALSQQTAAPQAKTAPSATAAKAAPSAATPVQGYLCIIGGGGQLQPILKRFIALAERFQSGKIVIYLMASGVPMEDGPSDVEDFKKAGAKNVVWANLTRDQAMVQDNVDALNDAGGVYFEGGDQSRLTAALLDTSVLAKIKDLYRKGAVIGGTSAGAAVMSEVMITGDELRKPGGEEIECDKFRTIESGNIITSRGFGFVTAAVIDQHHIARKRENRLISVIGEHPDLLGVAVNENTAILVAPDETFEVVGESYVLILDPGRAKIQVLPTKQISIENMGFHLLTPGTRYSLKTRQVLR